MAHIFTFRKFSFLLKRAFSSSVNLISSLSFRILFAIGNPPLNVFRGLRVHPNKLKLIKRSRSQRAALEWQQFLTNFIRCRTSFRMYSDCPDNEPPRM